MRVRSTVGLAIGALLRNKMRSLLTTLGVVIGVAAVVTMQAMGSGATAYVGQAISGLGSNILMVVPGTSRSFGAMSLGVPLFTAKDVEAVRGVHDVASAAGSNTRTLRLAAGASHHTGIVAGVDAVYFEIRDWGVSSGRSFTAEDERQGALVCLVGVTVADALFPGRSPLGEDIRLHDVSCRVVGIMGEKGSAAFGMDQDDVVFLPGTTFTRRISGEDRVASIMVSAVAEDRLDAVRERIEKLLRHRRRIQPGDESDFAVRDPRELQALLEDVTGVLTAVLAGVAALSLLVGGIGIMNIMLVSVTERTREIGIRLAVGARSSDILVQFLVEAAILAASGGALGVGLGLGAARLVSRLIGVPFVIPMSAMPLAFAVSLVVGIVFGVVPARKASRLNPLAALRFE